MNKNIKNSFGALMVAGLTLLAGCVFPQAPPPKVTPPIHAILTTKGVQIVAKNGDWIMEYMKPVQPPFFHSGDLWHTWGIDQNRDAYRTAPFARCVFDVDVHVDGLEQPLHGKMCFFAGYDNIQIEPSAKRVWTVAVPSEFVEVARTGNMAIVYQPAHVEEDNSDVATWILWLSSVPF